jgi:hypothetical protein
MATCFAGQQFDCDSHIVMYGNSLQNCGKTETSCGFHVNRSGEVRLHWTQIPVTHEKSIDRDTSINSNQLYNFLKKCTLVG